MFNVNEKIQRLLAVNEVSGGREAPRKKANQKGDPSHKAAPPNVPKQQKSANNRVEAEVVIKETTPQTSAPSNIKLEKYDQIYDFSKLAIGDYIRFVSRKDGKLKYGGVIRKITRGDDGKYSINIGRLFSGGKYVYLTIHQDTISALYRFKNELKNKKKNDTVMHDMVSSVEDIVTKSKSPPPAQAVAANRSEILAEHILLGNESEKSNAALIKLLMNYETEIKQLKHSLACITQPPPQQQQPLFVQQQGPQQQQGALFPQQQQGALFPQQ